MYQLNRTKFTLKTFAINKLSSTSDIDSTTNINESVKSPFVSQEKYNLHTVYIIDGVRYPRLNNSDIHDLDNFKAKYQENRSLYILQKFNQDHPNNKLFDYDRLNFLVQRSKSFQEWFEKVCGEFSRLTTCPSWILDDKDLRDNWQTAFLDVSKSLKFTLQQIQAEENQIQVEYREKMEKLGIKKGEAHILAFKSSPMVIVDKMNINSLPKEIYINCANIEDPKEQTTYLNNELKKYKTIVYKKFKNNEITEAELLKLLSVQTPKG